MRLLIVLVVSAGFAATVFAQPGSGRTTRTSFESPVAPRPAQQVTFARRASRVGDRTDQSLTVALRVRNSIRQGQQPVGETETEITQRIQRVVTTEAVHQGKAVGARVQYIVSEREVTADEQASAVQQDPIAGRAYHCRREGEQLIVTDEEGYLPALAEFQIVADSMDVLGRPNPLAEFLAGRTIGVGRQLTLPPEVAREFAQRMGDGVDQVAQLKLTLTAVRPIEGRQCAVFQAFMEVAENKARQMKLQLDGTMAIELATCRVVTAELGGPIGLAESVNQVGGTYQVTGTGRMRFVIASTYDDAG